MSWFARTIANSLRLDDEDEQQHHNPPNANEPHPPNTKPDSDSAIPDPRSPSSPSPASTPRGVKEDLSELTKSISRQLWGVASFLAPPPPPPPADHALAAHPAGNLDSDAPPRGQEEEEEEEEEEDLIAGIRSDFAEISGRFRSGISKLSENKAVSELTKMASNFLQIRPEEDDYDLEGVVGITEDVVLFARDVAMHPETWLDFPLPHVADSDDFDLSDVQQEHALAVESLAPSLAALRMELCPAYMSDACFWMIYFVLLHPRLNKSDADLLSTPQIVEARAMLAHTLEKRSTENEEHDLSAKGDFPTKEGDQDLLVPTSVPLESVPLQVKAAVVEAAPSVDMSDFEMEKHPVTQTTDVSMIKEAPVNLTAEQSSSISANRFLDEAYDEDDADDWLKEDSSEMVGGSGTSGPAGNEEDVSFSDLEEEDVASSYKKTGSGSDSSTKDSRDWVQLSRQAGSEHSSARNSETKDSSDWLNVDDIDVI
ncbi:uncharacterized protein LOC130981682 [Arachis stenosperma]|uniref:uncharacterized protein LOC130981682 n=1 Tax=Arachis stenosperma TaxID=217475 RepID=UPI0025AC0DF8|nr:uncharacterized protein LOC130981682 [Arachis stenosperma]